MDKLRVLYDAEGRTLTVWVGDPTTEAGCDEADEVTVEILKGPGRGG